MKIGSKILDFHKIVTSSPESGEGGDPCVCRSLPPPTNNPKRLKSGLNQCAVEEHEEGEDGRRIDVGVQPAYHHLVSGGDEVMRPMWFYDQS